MTFCIEFGFYLLSRKDVPVPLHLQTVTHLAVEKYSWEVLYATIATTAIALRGIVPELVVVCLAGQENLQSVHKVSQK